MYPVMWHFFSFFVSRSHVLYKASLGTYLKLDISYFSNNFFDCGNNFSRITSFSSLHVVIKVFMILSKQIFFNSRIMQIIIVQWHPVSLQFGFTNTHKIPQVYIGIIVTLRVNYPVKRQS